MHMNRLPEEFEAVTSVSLVRIHLSSPFPSNIPNHFNPLLEALGHPEQAAQLGSAPGQYEFGHAYEFALPPFPLDPLLGVQYYLLARQPGQVEMDMI